MGLQASTLLVFTLCLSWPQMDLIYLFYFKKRGKKNNRKKKRDCDEGYSICLLDAGFIKLGSQVNEWAVRINWASPAIST